MKKSNQQGSVVLILAVVFVVLAAIGGAAFYVISSTSESNDTDNNESSASETSKDSKKSDANREEKAIEKGYELSFVCDGSGWPSNVVPSDTGKVIQQLSEKDNEENVYNNSGSVGLYEYSRDFDNELAIDYVSCLGRTDTTTSSVTCEFRDSSAKMNVRNFNLTVYDLKTRQKVIDGQTLPGSTECPFSALIRDGEFNSGVDEDAFKNAIESKI